MSAAKHTPGRQCDFCEGFCLRPATIDEANTALAVARMPREKLAACEALVAAAQAEVKRLRAIAHAPARTPGPWEPVSTLRKPGEPKARLVIRRLVCKDGAPTSEYMPGTFGTLEEAHQAIAKATGSAA